MQVAIHPRWIPWADRHGRFVPLKLVAFIAGLLPALVLIWWWQADELGARSLTAAIHFTGKWTIRFLLISLAVSPLRMLTESAKVMALRRQFGLIALGYGCTHLSLYIWDQNLNLLTVASEILHRYYLAIGFTALTGLTVLGITSSDAMIKRLGRTWKRVHRIVYVCAVLGLLHHFMQAKADVSPAVLVAGCFVWLMLFRRIPRGWHRSPGVFLLLAVIATVATVGIEFAWYAIATHIDATRVFMANFNPRYGIRPADWVAMAGLAVTLFVAVRRIASRSTPRPTKLSPAKSVA
ncbi:MAG TPA: protein-methionine-sulfoxide reductase heme-binding subunit MsrQ [Acidisphaera sp.]|nr:protein-methionine-sulfoxide reductase heme-binding subunit MsrQ [Acidisphaera sp.]